MIVFSENIDFHLLVKNNENFYKNFCESIKKQAEDIEKKALNQDYINISFNPISEVNNNIDYVKDFWNRKKTHTSWFFPILIIGCPFCLIITCFLTLKDSLNTMPIKNAKSMKTIFLLNKIFLIILTLVSVYYAIIILYTSFLNPHLKQLAEHVRLCYNYAIAIDYKKEFAVPVDNFFSPLVKRFLQQYFINKILLLLLFVSLILGVFINENLKQNVLTTLVYDHLAPPENNEQEYDASPKNSHVFVRDIYGKTTAFFFLFFSSFFIGKNCFGNTYNALKKIATVTIVVSEAVEKNLPEEEN